jgi:hypothetical protein
MLLPTSKLQMTLIAAFRNFANATHWPASHRNATPGRYGRLDTDSACQVMRPGLTVWLVIISKRHCTLRSHDGTASQNNLKGTDNIFHCSKYSMFPWFWPCSHGTASINLLLAVQKSMWQRNELSLSTHHSFSREDSAGGMLSAVQLVQSAAFKNRT